MPLWFKGSLRGAPKPPQTLPKSPLETSNLLSIAVEETEAQKGGNILPKEPQQNNNEKVPFVFKGQCVGQVMFDWDFAECSHMVAVACRSPF